MDDNIRVDDIINMGCGLAKSTGGIQRSTAIEIIHEKEYNQEPKNAFVARFKSGKNEFKIHYREIKSIINLESN